MNDDLLKHFITETQENFKEVKGDIKTLVSGLGDLNTFRLQVLINSKWVAVIVSSIIGLLSMAISVGSAYYIKAHVFEAAKIEKQL